MKRLYEAPEMEFVKITLQPVMAVSIDENTAGGGAHHSEDDWPDDDGL